MAQAVHIITIDRDNPYVYISSAIGKDVLGRKEVVSSQAARVSAAGTAVVAAINGDFFAPNGAPIGMHLQKGEVVQSPDSWPVFAVAPGNQLSIGVARLVATVTVRDAVGTVVRTATLDAINRPRNNGQLVLFTPRYGTTTPTAAPGVEVVVNSVAGELLLNSVVSGVVTTQFSGRGSTPIPAGGMVLSGSGKSQPFLASLNPGDLIEIELHLAAPLQDATDAISGHPVLVTNGKVAPLSKSDSFNTARHPRTAVGFNDKQIFLVTVDGRQPGYASGMSLFELADLFLTLGATEAVNLDGGGSTTAVVRRPGEYELSVVNRPSDGYERPVSNALLVVDTAPQGELTHLLLAPADVTMLVGSQVAFTVRGQDQYFGPVAVPDTLEWQTDSVVGQVVDGTFTAMQPGATVVTATSGNASGQARVQVVGSVAKLVIEPEVSTVDVGQSVQLRLQAYDDTGKPVLVDAAQAVWSVMGGDAHVDPLGRCTANAPGEVLIQASLGSVHAQARLAVSTALVLLWGFEEVGTWNATVARASAAYTVATSPEPVHAGLAAGKLTYDFTVGPDGTAAAYAQPAQPIPLAGRPQKLGIWVYGDGKGHWLRANYHDGARTQRVLDFTPAGGLTWTGWKYIEAPLDPAAPLPLSFERIYVVEINNAKKDQGALYFDNLLAVYTQTPSTIANKK